MDWRTVAEIAVGVVLAGLLLQLAARFTGRGGCNCGGTE